MQDLARCVSLFRFLRKNRSKIYKKRRITEYCILIGYRLSIKHVNEIYFRFKKFKNAKIGGCIIIFWVPVLSFVISQSLPNQHSHQQVSFNPDSLGVN